MAKKKDDQVARKLPGARKDQGKVYVDELYFRHVDQMARWRQEYEHCQSVENALAAVSNLNYEEINYTSLLVREPWQERTVSDYSDQLENARIDEERKFVMPVSIHTGLLLLLLVVLLVSNNMVLLWISGTGVVTLLILLTILIQKRYKNIEKVVLEKQKEINSWIEAEKKAIKEDKDRHETAEEVRIKGIEHLLAGDIGEIFTKIDHVLSTHPFPFHVSMDVSVFMNIPSVKIWLPPKSIIPVQICALQSSGRPSFQEKETRTINKQYFELCAGITMKVMSLIYTHIPSFRVGYVYGMSKEGNNTACLFFSKLDRPSLETACHAANGLAAMQIAKATFNCDTSLVLLPVEVEEPEEWSGVESQLVRNLHVDLFQ